MYLIPAASALPTLKLYCFLKMYLRYRDALQLWGV